MPVLTDVPGINSEKVITNKPVITDGSGRTSRGSRSSESLTGMSHLRGPGRVPGRARPGPSAAVLIGKALSIRA